MNGWCARCAYRCEVSLHRSGSNECMVIRAYFSMLSLGRAHNFLISRYTRMSTSRSFKGPGSPYQSHKVSEEANAQKTHTLTLSNISSPPKDACTSNFGGVLLRSSPILKTLPRMQSAGRHTKRWRAFRSVSTHRASRIRTYPGATSCSGSVGAC
jgi:hypothetical protein